MMRPCVIKKELLRNTIAGPFASYSQRGMRGFRPDRVEESALYGLNARIFLEERHSQYTARKGVDEKGDPQATNYAACFLIYYKNIEQVVVRKHILQGKCRPVSK